MECAELNCLYKHMKKVRSSQASISINSCNELSQIQFFPASFVYEICPKLMCYFIKFVLLTYDDIRFEVH